jgi:catechol 2,3-dioxygenase-like lactoylglutathione lyase family enzyme
MNHFTILTDNLEKTLAFYDEHLGTQARRAPPFTFPGAWLYADGGNEPILHIVAGIDKHRLVKGVIDHMAFTGRDLPATARKLKEHGIAYELRKLPAYGTWQLFFHDRTGAKVEIDFDPAEAAPA